MIQAEHWARQKGASDLEQNVWDFNTTATRDGLFDVATSDAEVVPGID
jgi:hypothetical protein